jgi:hypothetical protein
MTKYDQEGEEWNLNPAINSHTVRAVYVACKVGPRGVESTVAEYYGISRSLVSLIANGKRWQHLTVAVPIHEDEERVSKLFFGKLNKYPELVEQWKYTHEGL